MSLQLQAFSTAFQKRFEFNEQEMKCLIETYQFRSERLNEKNILPSIWDGALKLIGKSPSDYLLKTLKDRSMVVITKHFGRLENSILERRAQALSTFVLDYLTTFNRMCLDANMVDYAAIRSATKMPINEAVWQHHGLHEINMDEFIDKGISWDGEKLSEPELADIFRSIRAKIPAVRLMQGEINSLRYIELDPELQALKDALFAKDLGAYTQLELISSIDARIYSGDKKDIYNRLKELRVYYNALVNLQEQILQVEVEKEFCD